MQLLLLLVALSDLIGQIYKVLLTLCQEWSRVCSSHISQPTLGAASAPWNTSDPVLEVILGVTDGSLALAIFRTHLVFSFPSIEESVSLHKFHTPSFST